MIKRASNVVIKNEIFNLQYNFDVIPQLQTQD